MRPQRFCMGLLSLFKRKETPDAEAAAAPDAVAQARTQARRRLIGAAVLLAIGVIGFPLLFETQPRPVRMDIPIEIPRKDGAPPLAIAPAAVPPAAVVAPPAEAPPDAASAPAPRTAARPEAPAAARSASAPSPASAAAGLLTERAGEQGREVPPPAAAKAIAPSAPHAAGQAPAAAASKGVESGAAAPARAASRSDDGTRARAILDGQAGAATPASAPAASTRIVVQVGAYTDAEKLREVRAKVDRLGFKTYTQVVDAEGQRRTRVRVGPFTTKAEADKVAAKLKAAGLPVAMLSL